MFYILGKKKKILINWSNTEILNFMLIKQREKTYEIKIKV